MAETVYPKIEHIETTALSNLAQKQLGCETVLDADLNFYMWGGKDSNDNVTKFLCKDQKGSLLDLATDLIYGSSILELSDDNFAPSNWTDDGIRLTASGSAGQTELNNLRTLNSDTECSIIGGILLAASQGAPSYPDDTPLYFGSSNDAAFEWDTTQTNDALLLGLSGSNLIILCEKDDIGVNFAAANRDDPTLRIQSADSSSPFQYIEIFHNQINPKIISGSGAFSFGTGNVSHAPSGDGSVHINGTLELEGKLYLDDDPVRVIMGDGVPIRFGSTGIPGHSGTGDGRVYIQNTLEVDGSSYFDSGSVNIFNDVSVIFGFESSSATLVWDTDQTSNALLLGLGSSHRFIICDRTDLGVDFGYSAATYPTLVLQADDTPSNAVELWHDGDDGHIVSISGCLIVGLEATTPVYVGGSGDLCVQWSLEVQGTTIHMGDVYCENNDIHDIKQINFGDTPATPNLVSNVLSVDLDNNKYQYRTFAVDITTFALASVAGMMTGYVALKNTDSVSHTVTKPTGSTVVGEEEPWTVYPSTYILLECHYIGSTAGWIVNAHMGALIE